MLSIYFLKMYIQILYWKFMELNERKGKEMFYLTTHSTHFIYGYMVSDIW